VRLVGVTLSDQNARLKRRCRLKGLGLRVRRKAAEQLLHRLVELLEVADEERAATGG
jgi:hypothetical protein